MSKKLKKYEVLFHSYPGSDIQVRKAVAKSKCDAAAKVATLYQVTEVVDVRKIKDD